MQMSNQKRIVDPTVPPGPIDDSPVMAPLPTQPSTTFILTGPANQEHIFRLAGPDNLHSRTGTIPCAKRKIHLPHTNKRQTVWVTKPLTLIHYESEGRKTTCFWQMQDKVLHPFKVGT